MTTPEQRGCTDPACECHEDVDVIFARSELVDLVVSPNARWQDEFGAWHQWGAPRLDSPTGGTA